MLFKNSVNDIGSAIHGKKITTNSWSFGVTSKADLALYYIEDSAKITCGKEYTKMTEAGAETLFAGSDGIPLDEAFSKTYEADGEKFTFLVWTSCSMRRLMIRGSAFIVGIAT